MDNGWLKRRREQIGTQEFFLDVLNANLKTPIQRTTLSHWENGERRITLLHNPRDAKVLADALGWSLAELLIAAGYDLVDNGIADTQVNQYVSKMLRVVMSSSQVKQKILLRMFLFWAREIPDDISVHSDEWLFPGRVHRDEEIDIQEIYRGDDRTD